MKQNKNLIAPFIIIICLGSTACLNPENNKSITEKLTTDSSLNSQTDTFTISSKIEKKEDLVKIYTQAISEFIITANKRNKTTFDTLYFGKHKYGQSDDFPDIELPTKIENTQIRLVTPEIGHKKQVENKSLVYVNMMGWVDKENAQFSFIVFTNGLKHQYDYFIGFNFNTSTNNFEMDKIDFENYLNYNGLQPKRISIFKDGKYVEDK